jgi:hypothetical protein
MYFEKIGVAKYFGKSVTCSWSQITRIPKEFINIKYVYNEGIPLAYI